LDQARGGCHFVAGFASNPQASVLSLLMAKELFMSLTDPGFVHQYMRADARDPLGNLLPKRPPARAKDISFRCIAGPGQVKNNTTNKQCTSSQQLQRHFHSS
jgi:hypothetical protein